MFTYKIYTSSIDKKPYLRLIPKDDVLLSRFGTQQIYAIYDIENTIIFINKTTYIEMSFYDHILNKKILYKVIKFYTNNVGKYINFKYNKKDLYWRIRFKITNTSLLLELL